MTKNNKKLVQAWISNEKYNELAKLAKDLRRSKTSLVQEFVETSILTQFKRKWIGIDLAADGKSDYTVYKKEKEKITEEDFKAEYYQFLFKRK